MGANLAVVIPSSLVMLACIQATEPQETVLDDVFCLCLLYYPDHVGLHSVDKTPQLRHS